MKRSLFLSFLLLAPVASTFGQTQSYLSFSGFGEGNAFANNEQNVAVGDVVSTFIWFDREIEVNATQFDLAFENNNSALQVVSVEVFNPEIIALPGTDDEFIIGKRWTTHGFLASVGGSSFFAFDDQGAGGGIFPHHDGSVFLDPLYDESSHAFLFGRIDLRVVGEGSFDIELLDAIGIVTTSERPFELSTNGVTINGNSVPEPTSLLPILLVGSYGLLRRRLG